MFIAVRKSRRRIHRAVARHPGRQASRLYRAQPVRRVFLGRSTQHLSRCSSAADWLAAAAMLAGIVSWGVLLSLLGS